MKNNKPGPAVDRRQFLMRILKMSGQVTLASSGLYSLSLIGSGGKFGGMTAGAKGWGFAYGSGNGVHCTGNSPCPTSWPGVCTSSSPAMTRFNAGCDTFEKLNCVYTCQ